jgi:hypothetical protein
MLVKQICVDKVQHNMHNTDSTAALRCRWCSSTHSSKHVLRQWMVLIINRGCTKQWKHYALRKTICVGYVARISVGSTACSSISSLCSFYLLRIYPTGSLWRRQSQQSFNTLTPFYFSSHSLHVSAPMGHPQVRNTIRYLKDYFLIQRIRCMYAIADFTIFIFIFNLITCIRTTSWSTDVQHITSLHQIAYVQRIRCIIK